MSFDSATLQQEIGDCRRRAQEVISGLMPEQLTRRPDPAKWSIAECIAHLNITAATVQTFMRQGIERGRKEKLLGTGPFALGVKGRLLIWIAEPPPKFRMPAPKSVVPPLSIPNPGGLLPEFMKVQDEWVHLWKEAEGLDLARINVGPRLSPFRCHLIAGFPWMMAHQRRHLLQAETVKEEILAATSSVPRFTH